MSKKDAIFEDVKKGFTSNELIKRGHATNQINRYYQMAKRHMND
jgi:hypothetical protein